MAGLCFQLAAFLSEQATLLCRVSRCQAKGFCGLRNFASQLACRLCSDASEVMATLCCLSFLSFAGSLVFDGLLRSQTQMRGLKAEKEHQQCSQQSQVATRDWGLATSGTTTTDSKQQRQQHDESHTILLSLLYTSTRRHKIFHWLGRKAKRFVEFLYFRFDCWISNGEPTLRKRVSERESKVGEENDET